MTIENDQALLNRAAAAPGAGREITWPSEDIASCVARFVPRSPWLDHSLLDRTVPI